MKRFFLLLLVALFNNLLCNPKDPYVVAVTEGEPSCNVADAVNAITGDFFVSNGDIVVQGAEPIVIKRTYISGDGAGKTAGWFFFSHLQLQVHSKIGPVDVHQPNGTVLQYYFPVIVNNKKNKKHIKKEGIPLSLDFLEQGFGKTNCANGEISGRNNLKNNVLIMDYDAKLFHFYGSNGSERCYKKIPDQKDGVFPVIYHLLWEKLPNGNVIHFGYDKHHCLNGISTSNAQGNKNYASVSIQHIGKISETQDCDVHTSDGRTIHYRFEKKGKHKKDIVHLMKTIASPQMPDETLGYHGKEDYRGPLISHRSLPAARTLKVDYYNLKHNYVFGRDFKIDSAADPKCDRVKMLSSPVGVDQTPIPTHTFIYVGGKRGVEHGYTEVYDAHHNLTRYHYSPQMRVDSIEHHVLKEGQQVLFNTERFIWTAEGNLLCKSFHDEIGRALFARVLNYDASGNVLQERTYGNISGRCSAPLTIRGDGTVEQNGIESYGKRFSYTGDGRHLRLSEEEDNGKTILYSYLPNYDRMVSKLLLDHGKVIQRTFFEYDEDLILIKEISDDGDSSDKNSLSGVTQRMVKTITPRRAAPFLGMPDSIEESYLDFHSNQMVSLKKVVLGYSPQGQVNKQDVYDAKGNFRYSLTTKYDHKGRVVEETNAIGQVARSSYDENGNKITFEDFHGKTIRKMVYDFSNRMIQEVEESFDGKKRTAQHAYDYLDNRIKTTDYHGNATQYVYDPFGHVLEEHLPSGKEPLVIRNTYNGAGQKIQTISPKGEITKTEYNIHGKPIKILYSDGSHEEFIYNLDGTLAQAIDQEGTATTYAYDVLGREILKTVADVQESFTYKGGQLIAKKDPENHVTTFAYDGAGRKIAEEFAGEKIEYAYDELGRLCLERKGSLSAIKSYDLLDRVIEESMEDENGCGLARTLYEHDAFGNSSCITRMINDKEAKEFFVYDSFNRPLKQLDALGNETHFEYNDTYQNSLNQLVLQKTHIDAMGQQTIETHDALGRVVCTEKKNAFGETLSKEEFFYDLAGNLNRQISTIFSIGKSPYTTTTLWEYGHLNRLLRLVEGAGTSEEKTTRYTYTIRGQIHQTIKPDGTVLENKYNPLGHLIQLISSDGTIHYEFQYNQLGQLIACENLITGKTTKRLLDPKGRILKETLETGLSFENVYDDRGRRTEFYLPDRSFVHYSYDALHLREVKRCCIDGTLVYAHQYLEYDLSGHLLKEKLIHSKEIAYEIDPLGRLTGVHSPYLQEKIEEMDANGHIKKISRKTPFGTNDAEFAYDDLYQLQEETGFFAHAFTYDSHFNRLSKDQDHYEINAINELLSTGKQEYVYDENGNPTTKGDLHFTYDALGRLLEVHDGKVRLEFTYDGLHRRITKTLSTLYEDTWYQQSLRYFLYDDQNEIGAADKAGYIQELRILGPTPRAEMGAAIAFELYGNTYAPLYDLKGSVHCLVNMETGMIAESYRYSGFGEEIILSSSGEKIESSQIKNPWRYCSKRTDEETHLVFFGRRYYEPETGRWLTPDPKGFVDGLNLYAYVFNDPLMKVDLWGLETVVPIASNSASKKN